MERLLVYASFLLSACSFLWSATRTDPVCPTLDPPHIEVRSVTAPQNRVFTPYLVAPYDHPDKSFQGDGKLDRPGAVYAAAHFRGSIVVEGSVVIVPPRRDHAVWFHAAPKTDGIEVSLV